MVTFHFNCVCHRAGLQQPEPGAHGAPHCYWAAGGDQADQPGRVHRGRVAATLGGLLDLKPVWLFLFHKCHICLFPKPRTRFSSPDCSATRICWPLAWFSAPAASCGSSPHSWPMVSHFYIFMHMLELSDEQLITLFPRSLFLTGSADSLLRTHFPDGMSESLIAYLLYGVLKALEYLHRMGYVHRSVIR